MEEYKSNSHKSRQNQNDDIPEKRVEKVVSGSVKSKKKNGLQKITNVFVPEDVDDVKSSSILSKTSSASPRDSRMISS